MFKKSNLFSKTESKILELVSKSPDALYEREIAQKAGVSPASANLILNRFANNGLVEKTKKGRMSFYSASLSNPALRQFKIYGTINELMPLVGKLSHHARRLVLFGSGAQGTNTVKSDVDLLVISSEKEAIKRLLDAYPNVQAIVMNSSEWTMLSKNDKPLYERINAGITLWEAEHGP